jgi:hypothetical protein
VLEECWALFGYQRPQIASASMGFEALHATVSRRLSPGYVLDIRANQIRVFGYDVRRAYQRH